MDGLGGWGVFLLGLAAWVAALRYGIGNQGSTATFTAAVSGSRDEVLRRCEQALSKNAYPGKARAGFRDISANAALGSIDASYRKLWGGPNGTMLIVVTERDGRADIAATVTSPNAGGADAILGEFRKGFA
jgi:hypothetical protein